MCAVLLPPGVNPIAVYKYIVSYQKIYGEVLDHVTGSALTRRTVVRGIMFLCTYFGRRVGTD